MPRHIFAIVLLFVFAACKPGDMSMGIITRSATTPLLTTVAPTTQKGDKLPNLQCFDMTPGEYSISFTILPPGAPNQAVAAVAYVRWKLAGQQFQRIVSITNGTVLSSRADAVDVAIQDVSGFMGVGQPANRPYSVAASLTHGVRPNVQQPPIYVPQPAKTLGVSGSGTNELRVSVPEDAGVISFYVMVEAPDASKILVSQESTGSIATFPEYRPLVTPGGWVPLFPGVDVISVLNSDVANAAIATVFFGIEG
jgi:hypothetical protein